MPGPGVKHFNTSKSPQINPCWQRFRFSEKFVTVTNHPCNLSFVQKVEKNKLNELLKLHLGTDVTNNKRRSNCRLSGVMTTSYKHLALLGDQSAVNRVGEGLGSR